MPDVIVNNAPALSATSDLPQPAPVDTNAATTPPVAPSAETIPTETTAPAAPPEQVTTPPSDRTITGRFSELAGQRREAELRAQRLEALAAQQGEQISRLLDTVGKLAAPVAPSGPEPTQISTFSEPRPSREAFEDSEVYESELVSWAGREAASKAAAEMQRLQVEADAAKAEHERVAGETKAREESEAKAREDSNKLQASWQERRESAAKKYEDFDEVTQNPDLPFVPGSPMAHAILNREDGAELAYYLGKHPEEANKIARMVIPGQVFPPGSPQAGLPMWDFMGQALELGKIITKLDLTPATVPDTPVPSSNVLAAPETTPETPSVPSAPISSLPEPPTPIRGGQAAASMKSPNEMTMEEYAAKRTPQIIAERRPGHRLLQ